MSAIPRSPNVVFVLTDEWRAQALGYSGDANARTAAIDRFAAESHDFNEAVSGNPVCCPARASFLTGQYPLTHGVYINDVELVPTGVTLGEAFQEAGYRTGYIGKWHLHGSPDGRYGRREDFIPTDKRFGFEYWKVAECTHDYNQSFYYEGDDSTKKYWEGYDAIAQTEDACRFIEANAHADDPYFLVLSLGPPHFPLRTAPEQYQRLYADQPIDLRPNVPDEDADAAAEDLRGYYAHIAALDDCFARLLHVLEKTGTADDTVVVFTSDHGDMMGSHRLLVAGLEREAEALPGGGVHPGPLAHPLPGGARIRRDALVCPDQFAGYHAYAAWTVRYFHPRGGPGDKLLLVGTRSRTADHFGLPQPARPVLGRPNSRYCRVSRGA